MSESVETTSRFFYFDLGNVLLGFSHRRAAQQLAAVAGADPDAVYDFIFAGQLQQRYESGQISTTEFAAEFRRRFPTDASDRQLATAASDIFWINAPVVPIAAQMRAANCPLGILSNTCEAHWQWVSGARYRSVMDLFSLHVLSFEVGSMKPSMKIYQRAIELAGCSPAEIFYVDDSAENVAGAKKAGIDAIIFEDAPKLAKELRRRGVTFNY